MGAKSIDLEQEIALYEQMGWDVEELYERDEDKFLEYESLCIEAQQAFNLFNILPDKIDGMALGWYGKDFSELRFFMDLMDIYDYKKVFEYILVCNYEYGKFANKQREKQNLK